jgi:hypothetical protein
LGSFAIVFAAPLLPPLPRPFGVDARPAGRSLVELIEEDHQLLRRLRAGAEPDVFVACLVRHLSAEAQYLYPTARRVLRAGPRLADAALALDRILLRAPLAREVLDAHLSLGLHQKLSRVLPEHDLIRLGNRVQVAQEAAPTRPHPSAPDTPPLNKLVDPALGVVDKVRDVLSRRTTWPQ